MTACVRPWRKFNSPRHDDVELLITVFTRRRLGISIISRLGGTDPFFPLSLFLML